MADETKGVEATTDTAPISPTGVENNSSDKAPADDPEAKLAALMEENAKLTRDRDNYRNAALALKGKTELENLDLSDPTQAAAFIQKTIDERLLQAKQAATEATISSFTKELARENKELKLALGNKTMVNNVASGGAGSEVKDVSTGYFSPEQVSELKARWRMQGFKETSFGAMLKQAEESARRVAPGGV